MWWKEQAHAVSYLGGMCKSICVREYHTNDIVNDHRAHKGGRKVGSCRRSDDEKVAEKPHNEIADEWDERYHE